MCADINGGSSEGTKAQDSRVRQTELGLSRPHGTGAVWARLRYAAAFFGSMEPEAARARLRIWALKPDLRGRIWRFLFPSLEVSRGSKQSLASRLGVGRAVSRLMWGAEPDLTYEMVGDWVEAMEDNAEVARKILSDAGISHFDLRDSSATRRQVGMAVEDRLRVIEAFKSSAPFGSILAGVPWTGQVRLQQGDDRRRRNQIAEARLLLCDTWVLFTYRRLGSFGRAFGIRYGTVISFWSRGEGDDDRSFFTATPNFWTSQLALDPGEDQETELVQSRAISRLQEQRHIGDVEFPIDLVCLWVDGDDEAWNERRRARMAEIQGGPQVVSEESSERRLFRSRDELKYAFRSIETYAPFIRTVYLVTDRQVPAWLDESVPGVKVVDHRDIFDTEQLPVFNSGAIDTRLHHIEGLSENFLVTNDDMMFLGPVTPDNFFLANGSLRLFLSRATIPFGESVPGEPAVDSAAKNNRELLRRDHGVVITQKFKHIMIPQNRRIRLELEKRHPQQVQGTTNSPFRSAHDVSFSHLTSYEALCTSVGVPSSLAYDYVNLGHPRFDDRLSRIEQNVGGLKVLCLNDGDSTVVTDHLSRPVGEIPVDPVQRDIRVVDFLEKMFPKPSKWEKTGDSAESSRPSETR